MSVRALSMLLSTIVAVALGALASHGQAFYSRTVAVS